MVKEKKLKYSKAKLVAYLVLNETKNLKAK